MDELEYMVSVYFNEDWSYAHTSWQAAVDDFVARSTQRAQAVPRQIDSLLIKYPRDGELATALSALGCAFDPEGSGLTDREWLEQLRDYLMSSLQH